MMNVNRFRKEDISIEEDGIIVKNTFFSKEKIADCFNQLAILTDFVQQEGDD